MSTPIVRRRKRSVEVDTMQWLGDNETDVITFTGVGHFQAVGDDDRNEDPDITAVVWDRLHSTWVGVKTGQHIVRGIVGEYYPIDGDVLADTYEDADTPLHAACRTEALTEGAALIENAACDADWKRPADYCAGLRAGAELLLAKTVEKGGGTEAADVPEFFRPGRTYLYTRLGWKFRCDAVTRHPGTGKRVAVGYSCFGHGAWQTGDLSEGIWAEGGWDDVTKAGGE